MENRIDNKNRMKWKLGLYSGYLELHSKSGLAGARVRSLPA